MVSFNPTVQSSFLQKLKALETPQVGIKEEPNQSIKEESKNDSVALQKQEKLNAINFTQEAKSANDAIGHLQMADVAYKKSLKEGADIEQISAALSDETLDEATKAEFVSAFKERAQKMDELQANAKFMGNELIGKRVVIEGAKVDLELTRFEIGKIDPQNSEAVSETIKSIEAKRGEIKGAISAISNSTQSAATPANQGAAAAFDFSKFDPNIFKTLAKGA